jgi:hypothetical protein
MFRNPLFALALAIAATAFVPTDASARGGFNGGFHGGGFHRGFAGTGWRSGGWGRWHGASWGWRRPGWGWGPTVGVGIGLGAVGPAWGLGWGDQCTAWRRVWTPGGWRLVPVNLCW